MFIKRVYVCILLFISVVTSVATSASDFDSSYVSVSVIGSGDDVILINGLASSPTVWAETVEHLQSSHRIHVFTINGFAGTEAVNTLPTLYLEALRDEVLGYIQYADLDSPVLMGHSMGGLLSLMVASKRPSGVNQVIVVDALPFFSRLLNAEATSAQMAPFALSFEKMLLAMTSAQYETHVRLAANAMVKSQEGIERIVRWANSTDRALYAQLVRELMTYDGRALLENITAPIHVLFAYDNSMPISAEQLLNVFQTSFSSANTVNLIQVGDAKHFIMWDQPQLFYQHLDTLL